MYDDLILRLIDAAKMSDALAVLLPHSEGNATAKLYKEAADAIEELSKPKWIPVTERLPDAGERVLCYCRANIYEVMKMRTDGAWVHNDKVYDSAYMSGFVTHWMPLPEPPKEE